MSTLDDRLQSIRPTIPLRDDPTVGQGEFQQCPVCDGPWRPWAGSRLPCHARCLYAPADQDALLAICEAPAVDYTLSDVSAALGVTPGILTANTRCSINRRTERHRLLRKASEGTRSDSWEG